MANAAPTFHSTKETANYARLCRLLVDVCSQVLRETFDKRRPTGNLDTVLSSSPIHRVLQSLLKRRILNPLQWGRLYPAIKSSVSTQHFDITLLTVLLRNICGLVCPATGWDTLPPTIDTTLEADIARIKCYRNKVYGHASQASVDDATFNQYWQDIQDALVRLGGAGYQSAIDDLKKECIDPDFEEHYRELLKKWVTDDICIKEKLEKIEEKLDVIKDAVINPVAREIIEVVNAYSSALKESIKSQTKFQNNQMPFSSISNVKTDEIFTNLLMQHGRKPIEDSKTLEERLSHDGHVSETTKRLKRLRQCGQVSGTRVEYSQDIFIRSEKHNDHSNPRSIFLTGKAGIGKTLFCQKVIRDWAHDNLFKTRMREQTPDFKFVYLLTFRQLNLLADLRVSLKDVLNCSTMLDDQSVIDDSVLEYITQHSEEVLIIIDGYDEFSRQDDVLTNLDERYPNDVNEKMPVAALCAKLIKGNILRLSAVMITSRADESDKLKDAIRFDRFVEITGFSEKQVNEYIGKYFKENEQMRNIVLDHVTKNNELVGFAHVPVLCFLMCCYFEYILKESALNTEAPPLKMSDLYFEVINSFILKHDKKRGLSPENTLDKLSNLAAQLLLEKKYLFSNQDMKNFTSEEIEYIKASGLLHCGPPFRTSFSQSTKHFCFIHLTFQEYLAARWFFMRKEVVCSNNTSEMVIKFMAGMLSTEKDQVFMEKILGGLVKEASKDARKDAIKYTKILLLIAQCLAGYQDKEFAQNFVRNGHLQIFDCYKDMFFPSLSDVDCIAVSFLLDVYSAVNDKNDAAKHQKNIYHSLNFSELLVFSSNLSLSGLKRIVKSLANYSSPVTKLELEDCHVSDDCISCMVEFGLLNLLSFLSLRNNRITDAGVVSLCQALQTPTCKVTLLSLSGNQITDAGVFSICQALQTPTCKVTILDVGSNQITDAGVVSLCQALKTPTCKVTKLRLCGSQITDAGIVSLCQALQTPTCEVTTLGLDSNQITDAGVVSLCQVLQTPTCKVAELDLGHNQITDAGVVSLCQALQTPTCKVTELDLSLNHVTNASVASLCQLLQTSTCKLTKLDAIGNQITGDGASTLYHALQKASCKGWIM